MGKNVIKHSVKNHRKNFVRTRMKRAYQTGKAPLSNLFQLDHIMVNAKKQGKTFRIELLNTALTIIKHVLTLFYYLVILNIKRFRVALRYIK